MNCPIFVIIIHHHRVTTQVDLDVDIKIQEREIRGTSSSLGSVAFNHERMRGTITSTSFLVLLFRCLQLHLFCFFMFPVIIGIIVNLQSCLFSFYHLGSMFLMFFLLCCFSLIGLYSKTHMSFLSILIHSISHSRKNLISFLEQAFRSLSFYHSHVISLMTMMARVNYH